MKRQVSINNYYENTTARFDLIGELTETEALNKSKYGTKPKSQKSFKEKIAKTLNIDIKEVKHNYTSYNKYYKNLSMYFHIEQTNQLIRVSDHWSNSIKLSGAIKLCGSIRSCYWVLENSKKTELKNKFQIGIVDIKNIKDNENKSSLKLRKKYDLKKTKKGK